MACSCAPCASARQASYGGQPEAGGVRSHMYVFIRKVHERMTGKSDPPGVVAGSRWKAEKMPVELPYCPRAHMP